MKLETGYNILLFLVVFFLVFTIYIFCVVSFSGPNEVVTTKFNNMVVLLPPIGIILSALLASISVLRTIENTNRIEKEKAEKNKIEIKKLSEIYILKLTQSFYNFLNINDSLKATTSRVKEDYNLIVENKDIVNYLDNNLLGIMNILDNFIEFNNIYLENLNKLEKGVKLEKIKLEEINQIKTNRITFNKEKYAEYIKILEKLDDDAILNIKELLLEKKLK